MRAILIGEHNAPLWEKIIRKNLSDCELTVSNKHFDDDFRHYDLAVITIPHPIMVEDSLKDGVPTLCTVAPTKNIERLNSLCTVSELKGVPFVLATPFVFSDTFLHTFAGMESIGKVKHINISYNDPTADKKEDVLWTLGYEAFCVLVTLLEQIPNGDEIAGVGLQGAGFYRKGLNNWVNPSFFIEHPNGDLQTSANIYVSNIDEPDYKISIIGNKGRLTCYPMTKEVHFKDKNGKNYIKLETSTLSWEEAMFHFFLKIRQDPEVNGQIGGYSIALCNEVQQAMLSQTEHINLN
jgi:predicted dehydrogenase